MKYHLFLSIIFTIPVMLGCEGNENKPISATATAVKNASGEVVVRDATQAEIASIDSFHERIKKIEKKHPAPQIPIDQETFAVISITEDGMFILENNQRVKMSGIKCGLEGVHFIRKFFVEETERLSYLKEKETSTGIVEAYIWLVDTSMNNDPEFKEYGIGPSYSGMNDTVILNNWCDIEYKSASKYLSRYIALDKISNKRNR